VLGFFGQAGWHRSGRRGEEPRLLALLCPALPCPALPCKPLATDARTAVGTLFLGEEALASVWAPPGQTGSGRWCRQQWDALRGSVQLSQVLRFQAVRSTVTSDFRPAWRLSAAAVLPRRLGTREHGVQRCSMSDAQLDDLVESASRAERRCLWPWPPTIGLGEGAEEKRRPKRSVAGFGSRVSMTNQDGPAARHLLGMHPRCPCLPALLACPALPCPVPDCKSSLFLFCLGCTCTCSCCRTTSTAANSSDHSPLLCTEPALASVLS